MSSLACTPGKFTWSRWRNSIAALLSYPISRRCCVSSNCCNVWLVRTGKESVEHPRGAHDDLANAVAGCLHLLSVVDHNAVSLVAPFYVGTPRSIPGGSVLPSGTVAMPATLALGIPALYLKSGQGAEPWRRFIDGGGNIIAPYFKPHG